MKYRAKASKTPTYMLLTVATKSSLPGKAGEPAVFSCCLALCRATWRDSETADVVYESDRIGKGMCMCAVNFSVRCFPSDEITASCTK